MLDFLIRSIVIGAFATAALDVWNVILNRVAGFPLPNWSVVGRWVASAAGGRFYRPDIGTAPSVPNENAIGWAFHFAVGILFAAVGFLASQGLKLPPDSGALPASQTVAQSTRQFTSREMLREPLFWLMFAMMAMMSRMNT